MAMCGDTSGIEARLEEPVTVKSLMLSSTGITELMVSSVLTLTVVGNHTGMNRHMLSCNGVIVVVHAGAHKSNTPMAMHAWH